VTSRAVWELLDRYGADGTYSRNWASFYGPTSRMLRLIELQIEKRRREGGDLTPPTRTDEERLFWLTFERFYLALQDDAERQCQVCLVLGIEPPEDVDPDGKVKARWNLEREAIVAVAREKAAELHPPSQTRPWYWCHEERIGNLYLGEHHDWPVVYAHDWNPETHPDLYGFADQWVEGEVLVIPADELPHEAEIVGPKPAQCYEAEPVAEIEDGVEVAEIVPEPRRRSGGLVVHGGWRELGTFDRATGDFVPGPNFWR
jgi:hypothetical protein